MPKKTLILSTWDLEGGATELTYRMASAIKVCGGDVQMIVKEKKRKDIFITEAPPVIKKKSYLTKFLNIILRKLKTKPSLNATDPEYAFFPGEDEKDKLYPVDKIISLLHFKPDIILIGLTFGFINTSSLVEFKNKTNAQIFLVMFDMAVLTGGCHVSWGCGKFTERCSLCPGIKSEELKDYTNTNFDIKQKNIEEGDIGLFAPKGWSIFQANQSKLFKNSRIVPFSIPLDLDLFTDKNRDIAKRVFNIPSDKKVIFAGSTNTEDRRKGIKFFIEALNLFYEKTTADIRKDIVILIAGNKNDNEMISKIRFDIHSMDFIKDYRLLSLAYQASDIYVNPSLEDAGPMMIKEALACGTPVVGFKMGYLFDEEYVIDGYNGYKVEMKNTIELAKAIENILSDDNLLKIMSSNAREIANKCFNAHNFFEILEKL